MVALGRKNLFHEKTRLALSLGGVAVAVALMLLISSFTAGLYKQSTAYIDHLEAEVVLAQKGVENIQGATSVLGPDVLASARRVQGVRRVDAVIAMPFILEAQRRKTPIQLIGYQPGADGGPWLLHAGRAPRGRGEVVVDFALAKRESLTLGDSFRLRNTRLRVVGLSRETSSFMNPYLFVTLATAADLARTPAYYSFAMVHLETSAGLQKTAKTIRSQLGDVEVITRSKLRSNDLDFVHDAFDSIAGLLKVVAYAIGALTVWLTLYTAAQEKLAEYGVVRALGASKSSLLRVMTGQALAVALLGGISGVGLSWLSSRAIEALYPRFVLILELPALESALGLVLAAALLAPVAPLRDIYKLEPAAVFDA